MSTGILIDLNGVLKSLLLSKSKLEIGKSEVCGLSLSHETVSRSHASIERLPDGGFLIIDSGSRNGTFVNGIGVQQRRLQHGDSIAFGKAAFRFEFADETIISESEEESYLTSISASKNSQQLGETKISSHRNESAHQLESANAWRFLQRFNTSTDPNPVKIIESILQDLGGIEGICCGSFFSFAPTFEKQFFWHVGEKPTLPSEIISAKLAEAAASQNAFEIRSRQFCEPESGNAENPEGMTLPIDPHSAIFVEGDDGPGLSPDVRAAVRGAASAIGLGLSFHTEKIAAVKSASVRRKSVEHGIIGRSDAIQTAIKRARMTAARDIPVLITGPSGAGKELFGHLIHDESSRGGSKQMVIFACNETSKDLTSELFGHEKGAFTGADAAHAGHFERANGSTIFLDEIGELSLEIQAMLLRVIETKSVQRVGGTERIKTDFRVVVATNRDLEKEVEEGRFREDLFYRIAGARIHLPPLAERSDDIPDLARHFFAQICREEGIRNLQLSDSAIKKLKESSFPGNVRQLRYVIDRAITFHDNPEEISAEDIELMPEKQGDTPPPDAPLKSVRDWHFKRALKYFGNNKKQTAEKLGIGRATLHEWLGKRED